MSKRVWVGVFFFGVAAWIMYSLTTPGIVTFGVAVTGLRAPVVFFLWLLIAGFACFVGVLALTAPDDE